MWQTLRILLSVPVVLDFSRTKHIQQEKSGKARLREDGFRKTINTTDWDLSRCFYEVLEFSVLIILLRDIVTRVAGSEGSVHSSQVSSIMKSIGQNPSEAEIQVTFRKVKTEIDDGYQDMVNQVDKDGTGSIDFPEFLMMMCLKADMENSEDEIRGAFQVFDGVSLLEELVKYKYWYFVS